MQWPDTDFGKLSRIKLSQACEALTLPTSSRERTITAGIAKPIHRVGGVRGGISDRTEYQRG